MVVCASMQEVVQDRALAGLRTNRLIKSTLLLGRATKVAKLTNMDLCPHTSHHGEHIGGKVVMVVCEHEVTRPRTNISNWYIGYFEKVISKALKTA